MTQLSQSGSPVDASDYGEDLVEALGSAVTERHMDADPDLPADRFIDREASWLDFNMRVLELAERDDVPLLERVKFLAIFATGLDEFFMVRVAGLKRRIATGIAVTAPSGLSARDQLEVVSTRSHTLASDHARVFFDEIKPALAERGIQLLHWEDLDDADHTQLRTYFSESVYPVLTPLGRRSSASVPLHLRAVAEPCCRRPRSDQWRGAIRARQGTRDPAAVLATWWRPFRHHRGGHRRSPAGDVPRHGGLGEPRFSGDPQPGSRGRRR